MKRRAAVVYGLTFIGARKLYVGSTVNFIDRKSAHRSALRKGVHPNAILQKACNKYGLKNIKFFIIETVAEVLLGEREYYWIKQHEGRLYNIRKNDVQQWTPAQRVAHAQRMKGNTIRRGTTMPEDAKAAISLSLLGNSYRTGILHDTATKKRIGASVSRAYAEGRRSPSKGDASRFASFLDAIRRGERDHPKKTDPIRDAAITAMHAETHSPKKTALAFGISEWTVLSAVKRCNPTQIRKWRRAA